MDVLVFGGSGKMGSAVAWDLVGEDDVGTVGLVGRREESLERAARWIDSPKIELHSADVTDRGSVADLMGGYDVGVNALPDRRTSYKLAQTAIESGLDIVDMLEEFHRRPDPYETEGLEVPEGMTLNEYGEWLHEQAEENGVTFVSGVGFAPGISNITVGEGIRKLDQATSAVARVGGIPSKGSAQRHPLRYMITWAFEHVLREYMIKLEVIRDGEIVEVDAGTELEPFRFTRFGQDEQLECAITPGMPSFLFTRTDLQDFVEKTVRWPGHWQGIATLKECGLLDMEPIEIRGTAIPPREFLLAVITPRLKPREGDTDVCVMWNTVKGVKEGLETRIDYYLWDEADMVNNISSMARVTGFSAAIAALLLGRGMVEGKGIVAPEDAFVGEGYEAYIQELGKRDIQILEEVKPMT